LPIAVDWPQIQVVLLKTTGVNFNVGWQYRGASGSIDGIDLTPLLGNAGSIQTVKSLNDPCGGFTVTFADRIADEGLDTVQALAEPMDMVEIRMARIPVGYGALAPLIMRGYISDIRRAESIGPDGTPHRVVVISGQDSGKLWQNHSILPEAQMASSLNTMLATYQLFAATGIVFGYMPVVEFVSLFNANVMTPMLAQMSAFTGRAIPNFNPVLTVPPEEGYISASILQGFSGGRFWDVLEYVADRPWNELFVRDNPDTEVTDLIFRPVPYLDIGGGVIMPGAEEPPIITADAYEIVSLDVRRNDYRTANFFWVPPTTSQPETAMMASIRALGQLAPGVDGPLFSINHPNSALPLYGLRKMEHVTRLMPPNLPAPRAANLNPPGSRYAAGTITNEWHIHRAEQLKLLNLDNVVFETVEIVLKGHERFIVGNMLEWTRGQFRGSGLVTKGYITKVAHKFTPLMSGESAAWTTHLTVERSDGFINRDEIGASPYFLEGRRGPYIDN
jgi:hypothetical protein